jgi:hypothetical protein
MGGAFKKRSNTSSISLRKLSKEDHPGDQALLSIGDSPPSVVGTRCLTKEKIMQDENDARPIRRYLYALKQVIRRRRLIRVIAILARLA